MNTAFKWVALSALFLIPFLPLYVEGSLFFPFISGKGFAFRILVEIAAASWLLLALSDKRYRPRFSWTFLIYAVLVVWMFIADLTAVSPDKAFWSNFERMDGFVTLIHAFLFFVVLGSVLTVEKRWKSWWLTVVGASVLVIGHGFFQLICAGQECARSFPIHQGGVRVDANLGNSAYLAAYLLFTMAIALWQAIVSKGVLRFALVALAALQVVILFSTATRGALLGLVGAVGLGALLWMWGAGKEGRRIGIGVLVGLLLVIGGFLLLKDTDFIRNDPTLTRIASISLADGNTRFTLWGMAAQGALERPITGWGHEGFLFVFSKYYEPSLYAQEPWFDRAHSVYIDWLVSGGIPAFLLFIALLASAVVALYRSNVSRAEKVMLIGALAAYAFQALFVFDNLMTYILLAAILAAAHEASSRPIKQLESAPEMKRDAIIAIALPIVLVVAVGSIWLFNVNNILAGQALIRAVQAGQNASSLLQSGKAEDVPNAIGQYTNALGQFKVALAQNSFAEPEVREQLVIFAVTMARQPAVPVELKQEAVALAFSEIEAQIAKVPKDVRMRLQYVSGLDGVGNYEAALAQVLEAEKLAPKKQLLLLQKGIVLWRMKRYAEALETFERAYELDTAFDDAAIYVASGKIVMGDVQGAHAFLEERFGTSSVDHDRIRAAYFEGGHHEELLKNSRLHAMNFPNDPMAQFQLAEALAIAKRFGEARAVVEETIRAFPEQEALGKEFLRQLDAIK